MPPLAALAPLAAGALGSTVLPALAGSSILGIGTGTLGGVLGGALAGGLMNEDDPLMGAVTGGLSGGLGGPGLAGGIDSALAGAGDLLGITGQAAATGAPTDLTANLGASLVEGTAPTTGAGVSASALAAPEIAAPALGAQGTTTGLESVTQGDAFGGFNQALTAAGGGTDIASPGMDIGTVGDAALPVNPLPGPLETPSGTGAPVATPDWLARNKDWLVPAAGVAAAASQQGQKADEVKAIENLIQENKALSMSSGQLPSGIRAGLDAAREAAKARVRSLFAQRGMSGSSSEAMALANVEQTSAQHGAELALGLVNRGLQANQLNAALYQVLLKNSLDEDKALSESIGRFASSLAA